MSRLFSLNAVLLVMLSVLSTSAMADAWLNDWLDAKTVTSPGSYSGQSRNYFSGGSVQARWRMGHEKLLEFQAPKIVSGCGGIDIFGGGLSFLDADRLVEKLQSVVQAAPAVGFDMALKTMCKECSDTVKGFEAIVNDINGLIQSDCQMAKSLAAKVMPQAPENTMLNEVAARLNTRMGLKRDYYEHEEDTLASDGNPGVDMRRATETCSAQFNRVFAEGSLVARISEELDFAAYADLLRGLVGDVQIRYDEARSGFEVDSVPPCRDNQPDALADFLAGSVQERPIGGVCRDNTDTDFNTYVSDQLVSIAEKYRSGETALTPTEIAFINASPLPVDVTLRYGVMTEQIDGGIEALRDAIAASYAYLAIDNLYQNFVYLMNHAKRVAASPDSGAGSPDFCQPVVMVKAIQKVEHWGQQLQGYRSQIKSAYRSEIRHLADYNQMIQNTMQQMLLANQRSLQKVIE